MSLPVGPARAFAGLRVVYALALIGSPSRVGAAWVGEAPAGGPTAVALRGLAARDLVLSLQVLLARENGARRTALLACAVCDLGDVSATLAGDSRALPARAGLKTAALAGGSAVISAVLALRRG